jgi:NMD protein affecting ribosome stability and mRNA decay
MAARCKCGQQLPDTNRSGLCSDCYHLRAKQRKESAVKRGRKCEWCMNRGHSWDTCEMRKSGVRPTFIEYVPPEPVLRYVEMNRLFVRR